MEKPEIIQYLNACIDACETCFNGCLNEKEVNIMTRCIELNRECSEVCRLTVSMVARDSENMDKYLKLCVDICEICAEECEKHYHNYCQRCAKACRSYLEVGAKFHSLNYLV